MKLLMPVVLKIFTSIWWQKQYCINDWMFMVLMLMLCFGGSFAIKCVSMNNQQCLIKPILIDLNLHKLHNYSFIIITKGYDENCNAVEDTYGRVYALNKIENANLKVFNMIKVVNKLITRAKHISCDWRCEFNGR